MGSFVCTLVEFACFLIFLNGQTLVEHLGNQNQCVGWVRKSVWTDYEGHLRLVGQVATG